MTDMASTKCPRAPPIGHNNPPGPLERAGDTLALLSNFLAETPIIENAKQADQAGALIESARKFAADIETERDSKVRPLNDQVATINAEYKAVHNADAKKPGTLDKLLLELKARLTTYVKIEEQRRAAEAEAARLAAEEAARLAREAEAREAEAIENAQLGEFVDVGAAIANADATFSDFQKADRAAARAEREVPMRIASNFGGRAISMRKTETLIIESVNKSIIALGLTEKIKEAILSSARDYRKLYGRLPDGIRSETDRSI